ncbi:MBL fold metallo-hydrolase [Leifsonia virtsii]|uniref:MBL fold metallo-hydrolase n=1 Tax=Leifsonia virtsii TaxID=3035915 RepID=A0ABT8IZJ8_9MICO|nr:MBL fold metallo-hydrolase [Leifsonia virtsii]MDN4598210.1 MBL fold metallo-hydrolase [Leifsonia virtsii]
MREVIEGLYRVEAARAGNAYLFEGGDRSVLVDSGLASGAAKVVAELSGARIPRLTDVVLTHYDPDHVGAAAAVQRATGATVWLGAADARILRGEVPPPTRTRRAMMRVGWLGRADLPQLTELPDDAETEVVPGVVAVPAPGHTPGHHLVRWRGVAFIGDAARLSHGRLVHFPGFLISDRAQADATLTAIAASRPRLVLPGHGAPGRLE